jgi:Fic family protein
MTYVLQLADDPHFRFDSSLLRSLHYMMMRYDLNMSPGCWRPGEIFVREEGTEEIVYEGPDFLEVPALMNELSGELEANDDHPVSVRAAMAHLNLALIHPFRDGNGRMARCLQTLVLAREGVVAPVFSSIEEYLGRNTESYYAVLADVGGGRWQPERDARPWIKFVLMAHFRQASTLLRRSAEAQARWDALAATVAKMGFPDRATFALYHAALGFRMRTSIYREHADVSNAIASRDLKALAKAGLLIPHGKNRGRFYSASEDLRAIELSIRRDRNLISDPFEDRPRQAMLAI